MDTKEKTASTLAGWDGNTIEKTSVIQSYPGIPDLSTAGNDGGKMQEPSRFTKGRTLESRVYDWLQSNECVRTAELNGVESIYPETFCKVLRSVRSVDVIRLCARPDFIVVTHTGNVEYVECKSSQTIERRVYEHYVGLDKTSRLLLIIEHKDRAYWQRISAVRFVDSKLYTMCYREPFTIDCDGWITSERNETRSGAVYKAIDLSSMTPFSLEVVR